MEKGTFEKPGPLYSLAAVSAVIFCMLLAVFPGLCSNSPFVVIPLMVLCILLIIPILVLFGMIFYPEFWEAKK